MQKDQQNLYGEVNLSLALLSSLHGVLEWGILSTPFPAEIYGWNFIFLQWSHENWHRWQWWIGAQRLVKLEDWFWIQERKSRDIKFGYPEGKIPVQVEVVQQGHRLLTEVTWVHIGIHAKEEPCISDPFKGRRMHCLNSHFYDKLMLRILRLGSVSLATLA